MVGEGQPIGGLPSGLSRQPNDSDRQRSTVVDNGCRNIVVAPIDPMWHKQLVRCALGGAWRRTAGRVPRPNPAPEIKGSQFFGQMTVGLPGRPKHHARPLIRRRRLRTVAMSSNFGYLGGIDAPSTDTVFLFGGRSSLLVSHDGGAQWQAVQPLIGDTSGGTQQAIFFNGSDGIVLGEGGTTNEEVALWGTSDGGAQWTSVVPQTNPIGLPPGMTPTLHARAMTESVVPELQPVGTPVPPTDLRSPVVAS